MIQQGIRSSQYNTLRCYCGVATTSFFGSTKYHCNLQSLYRQYLTSGSRITKIISLLPQSISQCQLSHHIIIQSQQWSDQWSKNRFSQRRFMGVNPFDDDDDDDNNDDTTDANNVNGEKVDAKAQSSINQKEKEEDENESDTDDDDDSSDDDESDKDNDRPTRNIKRFPIPEGRTPGPIIYQKTRKETFFQFDYRNVTVPENIRPNMAALLEKIRITMKDTELEPYHPRRGCETLRTNIDNLPDGTKFRAGGGKKSLKKVGDAYDQAVHVTTHRALRKCMFHLLWERHAIMTSGTTHEFKKLSSKAIGQSLLGPDTRIVVDQRLGKEVIEELWIRGVSSKYNRLIKRHNDKSADKNYLQYLQRKPSEEQVARMDWNTDLGLPSTEKTRR